MSCHPTEVEADNGCEFCGGSGQGIFLTYRKLEGHGASEECTDFYMSLAQDDIRDRDMWEVKIERETVRIMRVWKTV